jgi:flagellar motility protein MotE (MotC chaperone)
MRSAALAILLAWAGAAGAAEATSTPTPTPTATPTANSTSTTPAGFAASSAALGRAEAYTPGKGPGTIPPSLTAGALADELRRSSRERQSEKAALAEERARLEKLASDIAATRAALKQETERLQELLAAGSARAKRPKNGKLKKGELPPSPVVDLAKTVKGMKPDAAAALLSRLDRALAAAILEQMRAADAAAVVDRMDPGTGAALFALLARSSP